MALNLRFILEAVIVEVKIAVKYQKPHSCIYIQLSLETVLIMFCWNYIYIDLCTVQLAYGRVKNCLGDSSSMTLATQSFMISLPRVIHSTHSKGTAIMMPFHLMKARFEHQGEQGPRAPCWSWCGHFPLPFPSLQEKNVVWQAGPSWVFCPWSLVLHLVPISILAGVCAKPSLDGSRRIANCKIQGYEERNRVGVQVLCAKSLKYREALIWLLLNDCSVWYRWWERF